MAFKNLERDLAEMFGELQPERVRASDLARNAGSLRAQREQKERDATIPETKAQRVARRRKERARRVEGLARGQHFDRRVV